MPISFKEDFINRIKNQFDLNIYETKVWLTTLKKGIASAGEIAEDSGVPRSRAYDVLETLEKKGFVMMKLGKPIRYIAVKPEAVLERVKKNVLEKTNEKISDLEKMRETEEYNLLEEIYTNSIEHIKREHITGSIEGKSAIYSHLKVLLRNAQKEVFLCVPASEILNKARFFSTIFSELKDKKVKINLAVNGNEKELKRIYNKLKIKPVSINMNGKFFIVDREKILFSISKESNVSEEIALWLSAPFFVSSILSLIEKIYPNN